MQKKFSIIKDSLHKTESQTHTYTHT